VIDRLIAGGVEVCFANPGTSEMHFVAALDAAPQMRAVLCLFEGVATGAADGYARIAGKPAATLLHLGPGMANGLANLHNARRAHSPVVNVVGDHATYHQKFDAPLESDIDALGKWVHGTVHRPASTAELGAALEGLGERLQLPGLVDGRVHLTATRHDAPSQMREFGWRAACSCIAYLAPSEAMAT